MTISPERMRQARALVFAAAGVVATAALAILFFDDSAGDARPIAPIVAAAVDARDRRIEKPDSAPIVPRPYSERGSAGALQIEVLRSDGRPAAHARLVLHRGDAVLGSGTTDDRGLARLDSGEGQAGLLILPTGAPAHVTTVEIEAGRQQIRLPGGVSIAGRAFVGGVAPPQPIALDFWCQNPDEDVPTTAAIWKALRGDLGPKCMTSAGGAFEISGLREGSEWTFTGMLGYRLDQVTVGGKEVSRITAPAADVHLRFSRVPVVRGRVVTEGQHVPLARAGCEAVFQGEFDSWGLHIETDDEGRFRFNAQHPDRAVALTRVEITVRPTNRTGERKAVLDPAPERDVDLGDLEIPAGTKIAIQVRDAAGAPIEGAFSRVDDAADPASRTDAEGLGVVTVAPRAKSFFVGALKHDVVEVAIPDVVPDVLPVTLRPNAGLEIRVTVPAGASPSSMRVRLSAATRDVFVNSAMGNDPILVAAGATENGYGRWGTGLGSFVHFKPDPSGQVRVAGLRPAVPLVIDLVDALNGVLAHATATLAQAEWKAIDLAVTRAPRSLRGRVHDVDGHAIRAARVTLDADPGTVGARALSSGDDHRMTAITDAEGRFVLAGIFRNDVNVAVERRGYATWIRRGLPMPPEGGPALDVVLKKGCRLTVEISDAGGTPIRGLTMWASVPGCPKVLAESTQPGAYVFADVPVGSTATLATTWSESDWTWTLSVTGDRTERIAMPAMGTVVIDVSAFDQTSFAIDLAPAGGGRPIATRNRVVPPGSARRECVLDPVAPGDYLATLRDTRSDDPIALPEQLTVPPGGTIRIVFRKP